MSGTKTSQKADGANGGSRYGDNSKANMHEILLYLELEEVESLVCPSMKWTATTVTAKRCIRSISSLARKLSWGFQSFDKFTTTAELTTRSRTAAVKAAVQVQVDLR